MAVIKYSVGRGKQRIVHQANEKLRILGRNLLDYRFKVLSFRGEVALRVSKDIEGEGRLQTVASRLRP